MEQPGSHTVILTDAELALFGNMLDSLWPSGSVRSPAAARTVLDLAAKLKDKLAALPRDVVAGNGGGEGA